MKPKPGDTITVITKQTEYHGKVIPSSTGTLVLKLDNGYNVGIDQKNIKKVKKG